MGDGGAAWTGPPGGMFFRPAYCQPAIPNVTQPIPRAHQKLPSAGMRYIVAFAFCALVSQGIEAPPGLAKKIARRESETAAERNHYAYRQSVQLTELSERGVAAG